MGIVIDSETVSYKRLEAFVDELVRYVEEGIYSNAYENDSEFKTSLVDHLYSAILEFKRK